MEKISKDDAKIRINKLKKLIEKYRYAYHVLDKSLVSDAVNDSLKHELQELENQYPELVTLDSPTQRVGGKALDKFTKVRHSVQMLSMIDAFSFDEVGEWEKRLIKLNGRGGFDYFCMVKLDGLAIELIYENGKLKNAITRGDGIIGEDVTQNIKTIESVPLKIDFNKSTVIVRGEIYFKTEDFEKANTDLKKQGKPIMVNPRNGAAGSIRQLDPKIPASRKLSFSAWDIIISKIKSQKLVPSMSEGSKTQIKSQKEKFVLLKELGFPVNNLASGAKDLDGVKRFFHNVEGKREKLNYWIDGTVVRINDTKLFEKLGAVGKAQRGLIAWKFSAEEVTTVLKDIVVQVGRTGVLTPVAILEPVNVAGTTVSRATLHNAREIERKDVRIGDTIIVRKAGDIIPEVVKPLKELRPAKTKVQPTRLDIKVGKFEMPNKCPVCGSDIKHVGELDFCTGKKCFIQTKRQIIHFVSKGALDIDGLGPKIIEQLLNEGLIKDETDLFELKEGDLKPLERFAEKSAENLIQSIENCKKVQLGRFIYALGIRHVGAIMADDLAHRFGSFEKLKNCSIEKLNEEFRVGEVIAKSIVDYFNNEHNQLKVRKVLKFIKLQNPEKREQKLTGKTFVITGSLESMTREEAEQKIRNLGGRASSSVSKETDYVVVGSEPGSKADKAKKLNVTIINENKLKEML